jgi:Uma2 family endonuclease
MKVLNCQASVKMPQAFSPQLTISITESPLIVSSQHNGLLGRYVNDYFSRLQHFSPSQSSSFFHFRPFSLQISRYCQLTM